MGILLEGFKKPPPSVQVLIAGAEWLEFDLNNCPKNNVLEILIFFQAGKGLFLDLIIFFWAGSSTVITTGGDPQSRDRWLFSMDTENLKLKNM